MVVMDQCTRRVVGSAAQPDVGGGVALCRMFGDALKGVASFPKHLSTDRDPLFLFHRWKANLRILGVDEIKTVPFVPTSHPFVERLIGNVRRELLDQGFFWNAIVANPLPSRSASQSTDGRNTAAACSSCDCRCHDGLYAWTLGRAVAPQLFPVQLWSPTVGSAYVSVVTIET